MQRGARNGRARQHGSCLRRRHVTDFDNFSPVAAGLLDPGDHNVVAAAAKTQAAMIITENLKDFPARILSDLNMEAKSAEAFIADTIALDDTRDVAAIRRMRKWFSSRFDCDARNLTIQ